MSGLESAHAVEVALTLAALRGRAIADDAAAIRDYRLDCKPWSIALRRRYVVDDLELAREVMAIEAPRLGEIVDVVDAYVREVDLWLALVAPGERIALRTCRLTGVTAHALHRRLRDELGLDVERRTLAGVPWRALSVERELFWPRVVAPGAPVGEDDIALDDARVFEPEIVAGARIKLPWLVRTEAIAFPRPIPRTPGRPLEVPRAADIEALRTTARPIETPRALAGFALGPLRPFYPGGAHGVLYASAPADVATWRALDAAAPATGYRPVIVHGELHGNPAVDDLVVARLAWVQDPLHGLQAGSHTMASPEAVLAAAEAIDVGTLLASGGNPSYPDCVLRETGVGAPAIADRPLAAMGPRRRRRLVLVPTDAAWKVIAYLPILTTSGEATPSLAQVAAVARAWEQRYGARIATVAPAVVEWMVPPRAATRALAIEHHAFSPEAYDDDDTLELRAAHLAHASSWYAWWD